MYRILRCASRIWALREEGLDAWAFGGGGRIYIRELGCVFDLLVIVKEQKRRLVRACVTLISDDDEGPRGLVVCV